MISCLLILHNSEILMSNFLKYSDYKIPMCFELVSVLFANVPDCTPQKKIKIEPVLKILHQN